MDDEIKDDIDHEDMERSVDDLEVDAKKKKDLLEDEVESADDLAEDEMEEEEPYDDVEKF